MSGQKPIELVEIVANDLGDLCAEVVFVGGAIVEVLVTDPAAPPISSTKDVDIIVSVASNHAYSQGLGERLRARGLSEDNGEDALLCRWRRRDGIIIDIMPTDPKILGFSNRWFPLAFASSTQHRLQSGRVIRVITAPCFLGTKFEAFLARGRGDYVGSKDIEDLLAVLHGRAETLAEVRAAPSELRNYLAERTRELLTHQDFLISIEGHLPGEDKDMIEARLRALSEMTVNLP
jgi:hypothetical protein